MALCVDPDTKAMIPKTVVRVCTLEVFLDFNIRLICLRVDGNDGYSRFTWMRLISKRRLPEIEIVQHNGPIRNSL